MGKLIEGWALVRLPDHENRQIVAWHDNDANYQARDLVDHSLSSRRYFEVELVHATWIETATRKIVYADNQLHARLLSNLGTSRSRHTLIGLGKYALRHFSYYSLGE